MKKGFSGYAVATRDVHGVSLRALTFTDVNTLWAKHREDIMAVFDLVDSELKTQGLNMGNVETLTIINMVVSKAPAIMEDVLLIAADMSLHDKEQREMVGKVNAGHMADMLGAVFEMSVAESDTLKKIIQQMRNPRVEATSTVKEIGETEKAVMEALGATTP